jgi:hypothetical protein
MKNASGAAGRRWILPALRAVDDLFRHPANMQPMETTWVIAAAGM